MDRNRHARDAQLRAVSVYARRLERAQAVCRGAAEVREGLSCVYEQDGRRLSIDMPTAMGGSDEGPSPSYFGRAAICGCIANGIKMTAARENLQLDAVRVGIEQVWDNRGVLAMDGASPGPSDTRIVIEVASSETEETLGAMVARALAVDPPCRGGRAGGPSACDGSVSRHDRRPAGSPGACLSHECRGRARACGETRRA